MANTGQSRVTTLLLWVSGIAVIVAVVFAVRSLTREQVEVRVVPVTYQTLTSTVSTIGKVEPVDDFQVHAPFAGTIKQIMVEVDQHIARGALLVRMDDSDAQARLATAQATLENNHIFERDLQNGGSLEDVNRFKSELATATLDQQQATTDLATKKALLQKGAASQAEVAAAQQKLDAANLTLQNARTHVTGRYNSADVHNAQTRVADSEAAVAAAKSNLANVDVRAPISGTVYNIAVNQYDFVQFGEDIMNVADLTKLQVRAYFDEPEIGKLAVGQSVKIEWPAKPNEVWHGHITLAPSTVIPYNTRSVGIAIVSIDDPTPDLIPYTNVTITVTEAQRTNVLSIPREALRTDGARNFVYRIVNGKLAQTTIVTGIVNNTSAEIVSGLSANDVIVLSAKSNVTELTDGLEVKPVQ
jgi:HlyD family secretion protein